MIKSVFAAALLCLGLPVFARNAASTSPVFNILPN
jgi:hypothetical protein